MIFTWLTAPLSYAYRMIFGWCSSNAPLGFKGSPSHSQWISFRVTWRSSSGVSGHWKALRSSRFIRLQNPDPSHWRIFIEVRRRLQNATCSVSMGRGEILIWWWRPDHCNFFSNQWLTGQLYSLQFLTHNDSTNNLWISNLYSRLLICLFVISIFFNYVRF